MSEHYDFHYQPTGSGAISGQQVLEQTEDAINELGDYVNDNVGGAMDVAQQALETAQNAETNAQTALDTANSFSSAIQSAQQDASTALSTAQTAQTTASNANNTAIQAQQDASSAVTTANNASGQVSTLSGTVTALGQRVTTAEGNIGQNTSDISSLTTRVGTAEGNITTLQTDVSIAMGNASSAMATAGTVKQQAYVFRYSSTALVASSTNSNTLLDNTDNLKVGDKVIDSDGVLFSITAIDNVNSTFTIGSALVDLALDGNVVHTSGNETVGGVKTFSNNTYITSLNFTSEVASPSSSSSSIMPIIATITYGDSSPSVQARLNLRITADGIKSLYPHENNQYALGLTSRKWSEVHGVTYYYGSSDVEFSNKFVTTDTAQDISSSKTFTGSQYFKDNNVQYFGIDFTKGTAPSAYTARCTYFSPLTGGGSTYQTSNGLVGCAVDNDNVVTTFMHAIKNTAGTTTRTSFVLYYDTDNDKRRVTTNGDFLPILSYQGIGNSTSKWATINGLNPGSLSLPDLSNGVDISSYITIGDTDNNYTPSVDGWIWIRLIGNGASIMQGDFGSNSSYVTNNLTNEKWVDTNLFVTKDVQATIRCRGITGIVGAKFYPCQGNV